ncbi:uncharacterized protein LOC134202622 [Armigeres subalbatus]|uniref:uncharacterized protein LOC134202622 n=1 Tax=Armigeres subalbatus TaxID=124917 RepID=UPI002ED31F20
MKSRRICKIKVCFNDWPNFYSSGSRTIAWTFTRCKRTYHPIEFPPDHRPACIKSLFCLEKENAKFLTQTTAQQSRKCTYRTNNWLFEERKKIRLMYESNAKFKHWP